MNISYDYYKTFYYVAKNKSFTKAADELFVEQPNVTRTVKMLEEQLGCTLLNRSKRRVALTPEGEKVYAHLKIAFEHIRLAEEEIALDKSLHGGTVAIGASENALYGMFLSVLKDFRSHYADVRLRVGNYTTRQALAALKEGLVDFAAVTTPFDAEDAEVHELKTFKEIAVCGNAFCELAGKTLTLEALTEYPVVGLGEGTVTHDFYTKLFAAHGKKYRADIEVATADQLLPMIANNLGVGFVPEFFIKENAEVCRINIVEKIPERKICLVRNAARPLGIAAQKLFDEILSYGTKA